MEHLFKLHTDMPPLKEDIFENWDDSDMKKTPVFDSESCPYCFNTDCLDISDIITCNECGYIVSRPFDNSAEYRFFSQDDRGCDPTRVGAPQDPRLPEASLGTLILNGFGTAKAMYRVRKYHSWNTVPYKERSFMQTCERLSVIGLNHGINNSIIEDTKNMFTTLQDVGGRQGLSKDALLSACLYTSLKQAGSPRKPKDIADIFGLSSATFTKALKQMQEVIALARQKGLLNKLSSSKQNQSSTKATEYIQLPLSRLPIPRNQLEYLNMLCTRIAEKADETGLSQENMPPSLAAGCVAFVIKRCDSISIPLTKIAEACQISVATLQKCLRRLESNSEILELVL
jgi:transcription initiation factor TFIIB